MSALWRLRRARGLSGVMAAACLLSCAAPAQHSHSANAASSPPPDDLLDLHLRALEARLQVEGLKRGPLFERGFLPPSGRAAYPVRIATGECAVFVAMATASMADLDASLYTAEGAPLIEDDSTGARPTLTFCASAAGPVEAYLTLHAYQGAGSFVAAQFSRARRPDDDLRTAVSAGGGASALGQLAQTLHERGFEDVAPRVSLPVGAGPVRMAVHVVAGECYTLAAEGGEGVDELGLRLVDAEGGELANGVGEPQLAALQYCADDRAELALEVVARRGQGLAQVARFRAQQGVVGGVRALWLGEPAPTPAAWAQAKVSGTESAGGKPRAGAFLTQQVPLRQGEVFELPAKPAQGPCEVWQAELAPGLSRATLRVENDRGELLAEADSEHMRACVMVCEASGLHRVSLLGRAGFGTATLSGSSPGARPESAAGLVFPPPTCHGINARSDSPRQKGR
ncbi:MAG: hypothetical protein JWN48_792 [Myxococcaceae bacterium]|nr:hypothetical protein [Myxococcaceae bacterium]